MHPARPPAIAPIGALLLALAACRSGDRPADCGDQRCPAGTVPVTSASSAGGVLVEAAVDPLEWSGGLAVRTFGQGECAFTCAAIQECPAGTWPVFSYACFTCATLNASGEVVQGACGSVGSASGGSSPPGGDCAADADCPGGYTCDITDTCDESCFSEYDCKAGFVCDERSACVLPECLGDEDCAGGFACDDYSLFCVERCTTGSDCQAGFVCDEAGSCVRPECQSDRDCARGQWCSYDGLCEAGGGCSTAGRDGGWGAVLALLVGMGRRKLARDGRSGAP